MDPHRSQGLQGSRTVFGAQQTARARNIPLANNRDNGWIMAGSRNSGGYTLDFSTGIDTPRTPHNPQCKKCKNAEE